MATLATTVTGASAQQVHLKQFLQSDGLSTLSTSCLLEAADGLLWICTENGISTFDGFSFQRLGSSSGLVYSRFYAIAQSKDGRIWLGTPSELYVGRGSHFEPVRDDQGHRLLIGVGAQLAPQSDGSMLAVSRLHVYRIASGRAPTSAPAVVSLFSPAQITATAALGDIKAIYKAPDGNLWLGCAQGICRVDATGLLAFGPTQGVPPGEWRAFVLDGNGRLWARSFEHIVRLEPGSTAFANIDAPNARLRTARPFVSLVEDRQGRIVTRTDEGLMRWSAKPSSDGQWQTFEASQGLPDTPMLGLLIDHEGSLWMGTGGNGLLRWQGYEDWEGFTARSGLRSNVIWAIQRDAQHRLLVGTSAGCSALDEATRRFRDCASLTGQTLPELNAIVETTDGQKWFASMSGDVSRAQGSAPARAIAKLPYIRTLWRDRDDALWAMTYLGLYRLERFRGRVSAERMAVLGAETGDFSDAAQSADGRVWFASTSGLFAYTGGVFAKLPIVDDNSKPGFRSLAIDARNVLWASSVGHGLLRAELGASGALRWSWVAEPMVAGATISTVRVDIRGSVWLATDQGLMVYDGNVWRRFDTSDGAVWNDLNQTAWFFDDDGSLWFGTTAGLGHVLFPNRLVKAAPLQARITHATLGDQPLDVEHPATLPWASDLALSVGFGLRDFSEAAGTSFRYRLFGLENEWTETSRPEVRYASLQPGRYRLEIVAEHHGHARMSVPISMTFEISPPWWRTSTVRIALAVATAFALAMLGLWRERQMRSRQVDLRAKLREHEALLQRATRDPLTGLWNRSALLDLLHQEIGNAALRVSPLAVVMIDVDHFKQVNDTYGHLAGDAVLRGLGAFLARAVRSTDHIGRYGGEELLLVMPGMPEIQPCSNVEALQQAISKLAFDIDAPNLRVTASFGVCWWRPGDGADQLIGRADAALYAAKQAGRNRVAYARCAEIDAGRVALSSEAGVYQPG